MQSHCVTAHSLRRSPQLLNERALTYLFVTYLLTYTYTTLFIIFHGNSNPGTNPGNPGFVFHSPEIPGLEKGSGIASPN